MSMSSQLAVTRCACNNSEAVCPSQATYPQASLQMCKVALPLAHALHELATTHMLAVSRSRLRLDMRGAASTEMQTATQAALRDP